MNHLFLFFRYPVCIFTSGVCRCLIIVCFLLVPAFGMAQGKLDFYVSNNGNDSFPGTSLTFPKKSIAAMAPAFQKTANAKGIVKLGLKSTDIFEESLVTSYPIEINSYSVNSTTNEFAVLNGTKEFATGWLKQQGTNFTFSQLIPYAGFVGYGINAIGEYSFISVFEIDRELEKKKPFSARRLLTYLRSVGDVENAPGSFYTPVGNDNPMQVYIHTTDGNSPNDNKKYRYEVTVRDYGVNSTYQPNNRFENLWVRGFGAGIGMIPGGDNSYYNKIIFGPGAGIHHLVARGGTINHSLFLPGARNTNSFALTFYDTEGLNRHCTVKNSLYLDIPMPLYMHTSGGTNWAAVEMDNIVGFADSLLRGPFMYTADNDTVLLNNIYADGYTAGYNYGNAKYAAISNSAFKNVQFGIAYNTGFNAVNATINNVLIKTEGTDLTYGVIMGNNNDVSLKNTIIHLVNNDFSPGNALKGTFVYGTGDTKNKLIATGNIFICDIGAGKTLLAAATNTNNGIATSNDSWDNNVYILLKGQNILWSVTNPSTNGGRNTIDNFEDWKKQSGQDKHSLFFDLRKDPRGLKAIFEDPENGNYNLANTSEGKMIAELHAGMSDPLSCFLKRPSYEEAAAMIRDNKPFTINKCRNPCTQNSIKVNSTFTLDSLKNRQVKLKWNIVEQENIAQYVVQKATENLIFTDISSVSADKDSLYEMIDKAQYGIRYNYRLMVISKSGNKCYSDNRSIRFYDTRSFTIYPNPSQGKIFISLNDYVGHASFIVSNSKGETVLVKEGMSLNASQVLDMSNKPPGVYWVKVITDKGISVQNFILL